MPVRTLPELIYRLRFDGSLASALGARVEVGDAAQPAAATPRKQPQVTAQSVDVRPDTHIEEMMHDERTQDAGEDLLDGERPIE